MAITVELQYGVVFGKCDASDWIEWEIDLDGEAEEAYLKAKKLRIAIDEFPELEAVLSAAYEEIEEQEIDNLSEFDDEYVQECTGRYPVDPDEINDLVADRDPHTLAFFELTDLSDEELDEWDANDLDELPDVCDFQENFEPSSPFDGGYLLNVEFVEHPEEDDLDEDEATETLRELFQEANGDYSVIKDYIERCDSLFYDGDLADLAAQIAEELGITDFTIEE